ncbi:RPM1-interacting protein 4 isoform X2 [Hevea brasiliensis]|uniref:RPM1-interacting protein 4 isoform X2 n=1 Tax=Hevea brasiliensis TaxID=3981 RepID=UPI0025F9D1D9|nr:RPM1-interacting protein 4 isoform X2 [Hevea brasiliensis]
MAQRSHVPKFGNWDDDNIPYTAYFDNARKEKASVPINPNDPEQNPEAFMYGRGDLSFGHSQKSITSESGSSLLQAAGYRREKSERKKGWVTEGANNSFSTSVAPQHCRHRSASHPSDNDKHHRSTSIPQFGAWDETDPNSGEGFTVIFNRVKEEKKNSSAAIPPLPPQPSYYPAPQRNQSTSSSPSRLCCCLFSCGSK